MCGPCPTNAVCNECRVQRTHPVGLYFLETSLIRYFIRYRVSEPRFQAKVYERKRGAVVVYVAGIVGKSQDARQWYPSGPLLPTITDPLRAVPSNLFPRCPGCLSRIGHHRFCPRQEGPQARGACSLCPHAPGPQQGLLPGNVPSGSVHRIVLSTKKNNQWNRWYTRCTDAPPPPLLCTGMQSELQDSAVVQCQGNEMTGL